MRSLIPSSGLLLTLALLAACSQTSVREEFAADGKTITAREYAGGNPDYALYVAALSQPTAVAETSTAHCGTDARCIENVTAFNTIRALAQSTRQTVIQPPAPRRTGADRWLELTKSVFAVLVPGAVNIRQSDNATRTAIAQYNFLDAAIGGVTTAAQTVAQAGPTITYTGSFNAEGDTNSDSFNAPIDISGDGSAAGDGNSIDNSETVITTTTTTTTTTNDNGDCEGASCNPVVPEPEPGV